jgi:hypothetical protein
VVTTTTTLSEALGSTKIRIYSMLGMPAGIPSYPMRALQGKTARRPVSAVVLDVSVRSCTCAVQGG